MRLLKPSHRQRKIIKKMEEIITVQFRGETWSDAKRYIQMYKPAYEMVIYHTFRSNLYPDKK